jgi:hypothetical protein
MGALADRGGEMTGSAWASKARTYRTVEEALVETVLREVRALLTLGIDPEEAKRRAGAKHKTTVMAYIQAQYQPRFEGIHGSGRHLAGDPAIVRPVAIKYGPFFVAVRRKANKGGRST